MPAVCRHTLQRTWRLANGVRSRESDESHHWVVVDGWTRRRNVRPPLRKRAAPHHALAGPRASPLRGRTNRNAERARRSTSHPRTPRPRNGGPQSPWSNPGGTTRAAGVGWPCAAFSRCSSPLRTLLVRLADLRRHRVLTFRWASKRGTAIVSFNAESGHRRSQVLPEFRFELDDRGASGSRIRDA